jgi:hypothetical protein
VEDPDVPKGANCAASLERPPVSIVQSVSLGNGGRGGIHALLVLSGNGCIWETLEMPQLWSNRLRVAATWT